MKVSVIINVSDIENLKVMGSYRELKGCLEAELDIKLGVNGWSSLFNKICLLKNAAQQLKKNPPVYEGKEFIEVKDYLSTLLGVKITASGWQVLKLKISNILALLPESRFDPYSYYEQAKFKKFQASSALEGIKVDYPGKETTLENVLAKYKR